jgi:hypothetical protein
MPPSTGPTGCRRYSNEVTTPKLCPAPRMAQNRSSCCVALAVRRTPSAVTISTASRLSMAKPYLLLSQLCPPPRVSAAMPVVETVPTGVARPKACVSRSNSPPSTPGSARTVRAMGSTRMLFMRDKSSIRPPSQTALPAILCPPPRIETRRSCARANCTAAMTSAAPAQRAISAGS